MPMIRDDDAVCTACRWKGGHSPECERRDEPWPMFFMESRLPAQLDRYVAGIQGQNELRVGLLMCADAMTEAAGEIRVLDSQLDMSAKLLRVTLQMVRASSEWPTTEADLQEAVETALKMSREWVPDEPQGPSLPSSANPEGWTNPHLSPWRTP